MCAELTSMGCPDPEQAILDKLAGPLGAWEPGSRSAGGWQSGIVRGGNAEQAESRDRALRQASPVRAAARLLRDLQRNASPPRTRGPQLRLRLCSRAGPGGRLAGIRRGRRRRRSASTVDAEWVNLGGGGWPKWFFAGGWIDAAGQPVERLELRFADGLTLDDDATEDVALFITDEHVTMPATIAMLDAEGNEIATHPAFPGLD